MLNVAGWIFGITAALCGLALILLAAATSVTVDTCMTRSMFVSSCAPLDPTNVNSPVLVSHPRL